MKKRIALMLLIGLILVGYAGKDEVECSFISIANGEVISMHVDGVDVTNERKALEENLKDSVSDYYDIDEEKLDFQTFCMLGSEMITVEVEVQDEWYLVTGDEKGEVIDVHQL